MRRWLLILLAALCLGFNDPVVNPAAERFKQDFYATHGRSGERHETPEVSTNKSIEVYVKHADECSMSVPDWYLKVTVGLLIWKLLLYDIFRLSWKAYHVRRRDSK